MPVLVVLTALGALVLVTGRALLVEAADRALADHMLTLRAALRTRCHGPADLSEVLRRIDQSDTVNGVAIYDERGASIAETHAVDRAAVSAVAARVAANGVTFHEVVRAGDREVLLRVERVGEAGIGAIAISHELAFERAVVKRGIITVIAAGLVATIVLGIAAMWIAQALGSRLGELVHGADLVAAGDVSARVSEAPLLEIDRVGKAFNAMSAALADARQRVDEAEAGRRDLERRIRHAEALAIVGQVASSFAHEIGSPLSTILGWARLGAQDEAISEEARGQFETIATQCDRIRRIVERMLSVARPPVEERSPVDLAGVVREVAAFVAIEATRKGIVIRTDLAAAPPIEAVRDQLLEVVMNLAVNAIHVQPDGGVVRLSIEGAAADGDALDSVVLEIADGGPGIPADRRALVFEPFYSTRRASGGTGLGLAIVAELVRELGGKVTIGDAPEGGALFRITLPVTSR